MYQTTGEVNFSDAIESVDKSYLHLPGRDAVIVMWGTMVRFALEAARLLAVKRFDIGVLDLRWPYPLDEALRTAVKNASRRIVVSYEANKTGGFGAEVVTQLHEFFDNNTVLNVVRVATPDMRIPAAPILQDTFLPTAAKVIDEVRRLVVRQVTSVQAVSAENS
ncbi:MAG: dehydrogenase component [Edaphobacter sp.]|nr:dehydrogenase component [Edaphobacter sp.]